MSRSPKLTPYTTEAISALTPVQIGALEEAIMTRLEALDEAVSAGDRETMAALVAGFRTDAVALHPAFIFLTNNTLVDVSENRAGAFASWTDYLLVLCGDLRVPEAVEVITTLVTVSPAKRARLLDDCALEEAADALTAIGVDHPDALTEAPAATGHHAARILLLIAQLRLAKAGLADEPAAHAALVAELRHLGCTRMKPKPATEAAMSLGDLLLHLDAVAPGEFTGALDTLRLDKTARERLEVATHANEAAAKLGVLPHLGTGVSCDAVATFNRWIDAQSAPEQPGRKALRDAEARATPVVAQPAPERNAPCPCGSGKKYKKCCGA